MRKSYVNYVIQAAAMEVWVLAQTNQLYIEKEAENPYQNTPMADTYADYFNAFASEPIPENFAPKYH